MYTEIVSIKERIRATPDDIEQLVKTQEYMQVVPSDLVKIREEINKNMEVY